MIIQLRSIRYKPMRGTIAEKGKTLQERKKSEVGGSMASEEKGKSSMTRRKEGAKWKVSFLAFDSYRNR